MIKRENFIYSKAAIARMLNRLPTTIMRVEKWWKVCLVIIKGCRPKFFSLKDFHKHFVYWRVQQAKLLKVKQEGLHFTVINPEKNTEYQCSVEPKEIKCNCEDYDNQMKFIGKGCCKHGYAVLNVLGFATLSEYIKYQGES